jgi:hypothetical protein
MCVIGAFFVYGHMAKRKSYDWEAIEKEYRSGQLSIREIAKNHGCSEGAIRKKMKSLSVERDLSEQVAQKVRTELVRTEVRTANPISEKEIVEAAAARSVEVIRSHRIRIAEGGKVVALLMSQLLDAAEKREEIVAEIEKETEGDEQPNRRNMMLKAVALQSNASTAVSLSLALKNLVGLEREAFSITTEEGSKNDQVIVQLSPQDAKL